MKRPDRGATIVCVIAFLLPIILPALYVLSFGPACWLFDHGYFGKATYFRDVYEPIIQLSMRSDWFHKAMLWYLDFFGARHLLS